MSLIDIQDPSLNASANKFYKLAVIEGDESCSILIADHISQRLLFLKDLNIPLKDDPTPIISEIPFDLKQYRNKYWISMEGRFSLQPELAQNQDWLKPLFDIGEHEEIVSASSRFQRCIRFPLAKEKMSYLQDWELLHISSMGLVNPSLELDYLIHISNRKAFHFYFNQGELIFSNVFSFQNSVEFLYFPLLFSEHKNRDRQSLHLSLSGDIESDSPIFHKTKQYFPKTALAKPDQGLQIPARMQLAPLHRYYCGIQILKGEDYRG